MGFPEAKFDETDHAQRVAARYGTDHVSEIMRVNDFASARRLAAVFDEPFGDSSSLPTYHVAKLARPSVKVCLSGDGGDEGFAGYRRYLWHHREDEVRSLLSTALRRPIFQTLAALYPKLDWAPRSFRAKTTFRELAMDAADAYFNAVSITTDVMRDDLFSADFRRDLQGYRASEVLRAHLARADTDDAVQMAQYADLKTYLAGDILVKIDRTSMANSLEVRSPFLDHRLVEWAINLPTASKLHGTQGKMILKQALEPYLPKEVLYRSKMGFSLPLAAWLRGEARDTVATLFDDREAPWRDYVNRDVARNWFQAHLSGRRDHSASLWLLIVFNDFLKSLDGVSVGEVKEGTQV